MTNYELPPDIIKAAIDLENYFKTQGTTDWALLGVCSRNCFEERDRLRKQVEQLREALNNFMAAECGEPKLCGHDLACTCPLALARLALEATDPERNRP